MADRRKVTLNVAIVLECDDEVLPEFIKVNAAKDELFDQLSEYLTFGDFLHYIDHRCWTISGVKRKQPAKV